MPTVLYVDDEPLLGRAVRAWLGRRGTDVHTARSIEGAKASLAEYAFDGVFIDLWLSDGSGFELYDWLAEYHPGAAEHVAFVTGDILRTPGTQRQLSMLGCPVLTKPFDLTELDHHVSAWTGPADRAPRHRDDRVRPGPGTRDAGPGIAQDGDLPGRF
jgi:DNA-binding response OmpR family regulator